MARILVVDDDPDLLTLVEIQLRHNGFEVLAARGPEEALRVLDSIEADPDARPEVGVLDVSMPVMSGLELLTEIRKRDGYGAFPAIFLSARTTPDDIEAGRSLDAKYLTKPYAMSSLIEAIEELASIATPARSG